MGVPFFLPAYAAGLIIAAYVTVPPSSVALPFLFGLLYFPARTRRLAPWILAAFFLTLGCAQYRLQSTPPADNGYIRAFVGPEPVMVAGRVLSVSSRSLDRSTITLAAQKVGAPNGIIAPVRGRIEMYIEEPAPDILPGDRIRFSARLRAPRDFGTPGEFDFSRHLAYQGIFVTAVIRHADDIVSFGTASASPLQSLEKERARLGRFIDARLDPAAAPFVKALVLGEKGEIPPEQRELLSRGGISHLFSISGLHLALVALLLFSLARFFYRRSETLLLASPPGRPLPALLIPFLLFYLLLTGGALPTWRAFLMALAAAILIFSARRTPPLKLLAAAAFLILLISPLALFEPSFQLSFAGVLGILVLVPRWQKRLAKAPRPLRWVATLWLATLAATLTTLPLVLFHFHLLAPAGLLTNLAAVPAVGFLAVPLGLAGGLLFPVSPAAAEVLLRCCGLVIQAALKMVAWIVAIPGLGGWRLFCSPLEIAGSCLLIGALFWTGHARRVRLVRGGLLLLAVLFMAWPISPAGMTVTALSVGQGDSFLLSRSGGRHYLIDGGGLRSETFDVGERLVAPALGWLGVRKLEAVVLTHDHPDHRKGLIFILGHFAVKAFWTDIPFDRLDPTLKAVLQARKTPIVRYRPGWTILDDGQNRGLAVFVPPQHGASLNDRSLVLVARRGREGVLLTGDLESAGVRSLVESHPPASFAVTLLKLPHHGSRYSAPAYLLDAFKPALAFVSAGKDNPYHFPHAAVLSALRRRGVPLFRTDLAGTLQFRTRGRGWDVSHWRNGLFRPIPLTETRNFATLKN